MSLTLPLEHIRPDHASVVGGKAAALAQLAGEGIAVPGGLAISTGAYRRYVSETGLEMRIAREACAESRSQTCVGRSCGMRRFEFATCFSLRTCPKTSTPACHREIDRRFADRPVAVRSSAPGEDSDRTSFAGLHESFVNVRGRERSWIT